MMRKEVRLRIIGTILFLVLAIAAYVFRCTNNTGSLSDVMLITEDKVYDDNGRIVHLAFLDSDGNPVMNAVGYYSIDYVYDGNLIKEFYFDQFGEPMQLARGQYGLAYEQDENGRKTKEILLGLDGSVITGERGYAIRQMTYDQDGRMKTVLYYDEEGIPCKNTNGYYGIFYWRSFAFYYNADGSLRIPMLQIFFKVPALIVAGGILIIVLLFELKGIWRSIVFILYMGFVGYITVFERNYVGTNIQLIPFYSYLQSWGSYKVRNDTICNILLFLPIGIETQFRLHKKSVKTTVIISFLISLMIELTQLIGGLGMCETDDLISNSLGGFIGAYLVCIYIEKGYHHVWDAKKDFLALLPWKT